MHWSIVLARIDLVPLYFRLLWYHSVLRGSIDQKHTKKNRNLRKKQWNPLSFRLFPLASTISRSFQTVRRVSEAWESQESAVKYLHVGRRKIQIYPPPGEQDQSNALLQGQQRQSNPHPMPPPPLPCRHDIDRCIILIKLFLSLNGKTS